MRDEIIAPPSKLRGYFFDPCDRCCRCSVGCSLRRKGCVSPSHPFERFHRCSRFHNALLLEPEAWRNGLRLLTGEHQAALYVTALQTLRRMVLEAGDRHGAVLHPSHTFLPRTLSIALQLLPFNAACVVPIPLAFRLRTLKP